jgi:hypothetical protein
MFEKNGVTRVQEILIDSSIYRQVVQRRRIRGALRTSQDVHKRAAVKNSVP